MDGQQQGPQPQQAREVRITKVPPTGLHNVREGVVLRSGKKKQEVFTGETVKLTPEMQEEFDDLKVEYEEVNE